MNKDNLRLASKLLGDFSSFLGNRSTFFLLKPNGIFKTILKWHFDVWKKEHEYLNQTKKSDQWFIYSELYRILDLIVEQMEVSVLKDEVGTAYPFVKILKEHVDCYKNFFLDDHHSYADSLFNTFYRVFFGDFELSKVGHDILRNFFPEEWKITKSNMEDTKNIIAKISLQYYLEWAQRRIWQPKGDFDAALNDISTNLFPETNPILWAMILIFLFSPYGENRVASVVETTWNFGLIGRVQVGGDWETIRRNSESEESKTLALAYYLFKEEFAKDKIQSYIVSLTKLTYDKASKEESRRLQLLHLFEKLLAFPFPFD